MFGLEKYRYIFGRPGKGVHRFRICNIAVVDVFFTFLLAKFLEIAFFPDSNYYIVLTGTFILGIILHHMFGVVTPIQKFLFGGN